MNETRNTDGSSTTVRQQTGGIPASDAVKNLGWQVTFAGLGINLALGILYTWSVIKGPMMKAVEEGGWGWTKQQAGWPYSIACLVFALLMVPAGRLQDKAGPRLAATIGGILVGLGMILAGLSGLYLGAASYWGYILGFGVLVGAGIGFGYAAATPPAVKWFPASRTGLIAGLVVAGFGLANVYAAPLSEWLLFKFGVAQTTLILGVAFLIVVVGLAQLLAPPPKGYVPAGSSPVKAAAASRADFTLGEVCRTWQFYLLWFLYFCGAGAGLMIIANLKPLAKDQVHLTLGFVLVAALGVGNGAGRVIAGIISDKLGRQLTLCGFFLIQAAMMVVLTMAQPGSPLANMYVMALLSALIGANYGANLALFPAITKDYYGLKGFGLNYGMVFTAWGVGGFALSKLQDYLCDTYKSYTMSCYVAAGLLVVSAVLTFALRPPHGSTTAKS